MADMTPAEAEAMRIKLQEYEQATKILGGELTAFLGTEPRLLMTLAFTDVGNRPSAKQIKAPVKQEINTQSSSMPEVSIHITLQILHGLKKLGMVPITVDNSPYFFFGRKLPVPSRQPFRKVLYYLINLAANFDPPQEDQSSTLAVVAS